MALNSGDIGFVQYNADGTDNFAFVALVDIPASEQIFFTDNGWFGDDSGFRANEGILTYTAPAGGLAAGTVVTIDTTPSASAGTVTPTGSLNFSGSGDQVLAYQGSVGDPDFTFIAALNNEGGAVWQADATSSNTSALPLGLVDGATAVAIQEVDNVAYSGPTAGDAATLLAALNDASNWTGGDNSSNQTFSGSFAIADGTPDTTPPTVVALSPADDDTSVAVDTDLQATFDENIALGTGDIVLRLLADDSAIETFAAASSAQLSISGGTLTIDPSSDLAASTGVYVEIASGAIEDAAGNDFAGISGNSIWNFTTAAASSGPSVIINEFLYDPAADLNGDANGDGTRDASGDEFVEIVNVSGAAIEISGWTLSDDGGDDFAFPAGTVLSDGQAAVLFGGGTPTGTFGGAQVFTDDGSIGSGLANGGDLIELRDDTATLIDSVGYGSAGSVSAGADQSVTRDPDLSGSFTDHSTATGASGALFSPGTQIDGTPFGAAAAPSVAINELRISSSGSSDDTSNFVELFGSPDTSLNGLTLVVLSSEFEPGQVDFAIALSDGSTDSDGIALIADSDTSAAIDAGDVLVGGLDFFGSPSTFLVVENFTGSQGADLDTDNDGTLDSTPWDGIIADLSLIDGDGDPDFSYSSTVEGPDGSFAPAGLARVPDGTGSFQLLVFSDTSDDTPGALNTTDDGGGGGDITPRFIHEIQGNETTQLPNTPNRGEHDDISPLIGESVEIQGVVTAVYPELSAFFVQEEDADTDADPSTSEGIYVFTGSAPTVSEGNLVTVTGAVDEFFGMTQIDNDNGDFSVAIADSGDNLGLVTPATIDLPATGDIDNFFEQYEGMLVEFGDKLVVSEYFQLARFGQIVLTAGDRPFQYTHLDNTPTAAEFQQFQEDLARRQIVLDDDDNQQNSPLPDGVVFHPQPDGFGVGTQGADFFRGGDSISELTGVLHWSFAGASGTDAWRVRPTEANPVSFDVENPRPAAPEPVGGNIKVSGFNVLNYFTTLDAGNNTVGPNDLDPRGASSTDELTRQTEKLVAALAEIDADVFGLVELENDSSDATLQAIVDALNAEVGAGTYDFVPTGFSGTDAIKVGMIYKPGVVTPTGSVELLTDAAFTDPNSTGQRRNRPAQAQTFEVTDPSNPDFGESFTAVVNHFKSKGDSGLDDNPSLSPADVDQGDGQGFWNDTRTDAADYLVNTWVPDLVANEGFDEDVLVLGDLNAYKGEDPIEQFADAGYTDLVESFVGNDAYSFVFDGQLGYLDYALSNPALTPQVTGVTEWHINADEVNLFDYNNTVEDGNERDFEAKPSGNELFEPNAFRTSDHDPIVVGLDLAGPIPEPPLVFGKPATIFLDDASIVVGNAFQAGEVYAGQLFSNTDPGSESGASPDDVILGTDGDDNIWGGTEGSDLISALEGNDTVGFGDGDARVDAGPGDDFVYAAGSGAGDNQIELGSGSDNFWATAGNNTVTGSDDNLIGIGTGDDTVNTGSGNDFVYTVDGDGSSNTLNLLNLGDGFNQVYLENGNYTINTGSSDDELGLGTGTDEVDAGDGNNIIYLVDPSGATTGDKDILTGSGDDFVETGAGSDRIDAGMGLNTLFGGAGPDTFVARSGAYNFIGDFELGVDRIELVGLVLEDLSFFSGSGDTANDTFVFADEEEIAGVANLTVAELENEANFPPA